MSPDDTPDIVIAGGGVAGGMAACLLAQAGKNVVLLERDAQPRHKICGEFISIEAQAYLAGAGLNLAALGAHPVPGMRLVSGGIAVESPLPFVGLGLSRRVLDAALLERAAACGAQIRRGCHIRHARHDGRFLLDVANFGEVAARSLFLATGKHDLRAWPRQPERRPEALIGFKIHFLLAPQQQRALTHHVELLLFSAGYGGLQMVEDGRVNLCLLVERAYFDSVGGVWSGLLTALQNDSDHLRRRLDGAQALMDQPLSIYRVPYGFVHRGSAGDEPGPYRLGDQAAVTPSFSGDGIAMALHSAVLAAQAWLAQAGAESYHRRLRKDVLPQIRAATFLYRTGRSFAGRRLLLAAARMWPASLLLATAVTRLRAAGKRTPDIRQPDY